MSGKFFLDNDMITFRQWLETFDNIGVKEYEAGKKPRRHKKTEEDDIPRYKFDIVGPATNNNLDPITKG